MSDSATEDTNTDVNPVESPSQNYLVVQHLTRMPSLYARGLVYLVLLLIVFGVLFSAFMRIDIYVTSAAVVDSETRPSMLYPPNAGFIREIYAKQWEVVAEGTPLYLMEIPGAEGTGSRFATISAGSAGSISAVMATTVGEWVTPTTPLCTTLPESQEFIMSIFVSGEDIAKIEIGMPVNYKLHAFPHSEYGVLTGRIERISPTTTQFQNGTAAYHVIGSLQRPYFPGKETHGEVREGMTGTAEFNTGNRTLLSVLFRTSGSSSKE